MLTESGRFVITKTGIASRSIVFLTDVIYWNSNYQALKDWCDEHCCDQRGMTVDLPNEQAELLFVLRWA